MQPAVVEQLAHHAVAIDHALDRVLRGVDHHRRAVRLVQHQLDLVLTNEPVPSDPDRPLHCVLLGSEAIGLVGPASAWQGQTLRAPDELDGLELAQPGPRHALRGQFDALCK